MESRSRWRLRIEGKRRHIAPGSPESPEGRASATLCGFQYSFRDAGVAGKLAHAVVSGRLDVPPLDHHRKAALGPQYDRSLAFDCGACRETQAELLCDRDQREQKLEHCKFPADASTLTAAKGEVGIFGYPSAEVTVPSFGAELLGAFEEPGIAVNYPLAHDQGGALGNWVSADLAFLESGSVQGPRRGIEAHRLERDHSSVGKRSKVGERRLSFSQHGDEFVFKFALNVRMSGEQVPTPCERSRCSFVSRNKKRHDVVAKSALAAGCIARLGRIEQKR